MWRKKLIPLPSLISFKMISFSFNYFNTSSKHVNFNKIKVIVFGFIFVFNNSLSVLVEISINQTVIGCILPSVSVYLHGRFGIRMTVCL